MSVRVVQQVVTAVFAAVGQVNYVRSMVLW